MTSELETASCRVMDSDTLNRLAERRLPNGRLYPPMVEYRSRPVSQCTSSEELLSLHRDQTTLEDSPPWEKRSESRLDPSSTWPRNSLASVNATDSIRNRRATSERLHSATQSPEDTYRETSVLADTISEPPEVSAIKTALETNMFSRHMPLSKFRHWYNILRENNVEMFEKLFDNISTQGRFHLLNVPFHWDTNEKECLYCLPTMIAVTFRSSDVLSLLFNRGANILNHDANEENLLHCMCRLSQLHPKFEDFYVDLFQELALHIDENVWKRAVLTEEKDGLRPLELAAKLGTFGMMKCIVETENVYKFINSKNNSYQYDFGEYESWDKVGRRGESPLRFLLYMQALDLRKPQCRELLCTGPISRWIEKKVRDTRFYAFLWLLFRLTIISIFLAFSAENRVQYLHQVGLGTECAPAEEESDHIKKVHKTFDILLLITTSTILATDLLEGIVQLTCGGTKRKFYERPRQFLRSVYVVQWAWDRTLQTLLLVCMLSYQIIVFFEMKHEIDDSLCRTSKTVLHTLFCFLATFSILQFFKQFKCMSYFAIVLQKLSWTFFVVLLVFILFYTFFTIAVYYVMGYPCHVREFNVVSDLFNLETLREPLLDNSEASVALVYATFAMLGLVFGVSLIVSVIVQACMLAISGEVEIIHTLYRLDMAMTLENRIGWLVLAPCRVSSRTIHGIIKL